MNPPCPPPLGSDKLRKLLNAVLPSDSDFDAFCFDYFPATFRKISKGMDRVAKQTLLLEDVDGHELLGKLHEVAPEKTQRWLSEHAPGFTRSNGRSTLPPGVGAGMLPRVLRYERLHRHTLVHNVLVNYLRVERVATLLQTYLGGGKTLARQIESLCHGWSVCWLRTSALSERSTTAEFYQGLTLTDWVQNQAHFAEWLSCQLTADGLLIVLAGTQGPEGLLEEIAANIRSLHSQHPAVAFLIIGGERVLRLRNCEHYSWCRLLPPDSFVDVPDLTEPEIVLLLRQHKLPEERAAMLHRSTGGHPWLLRTLIIRGVAEAEQADREILYQLKMNPKPRQHLDDPQARSVIQRLLQGQEVAPLSDPSVRHEPGRFAESRLYFDGLLRSDESGRTRFRCPAARSLFE